MTFKQQKNRFFMILGLGLVALMMAVILDADKKVTGLIGGGFCIAALWARMFTIKCPHCNDNLGNHNFLSMKFCPSCGEKVYEE